MASQSCLTNEEIKHRIMNVYAKFVSDVEPDRLCDWLVQESVITLEQSKVIRSENKTLQKRCRALLDLLFTSHNPRTFLVIREALIDGNHYLLTEIDNQEPTSVQSDGKPASEEIRKDEETLKQRVFQLETELGLQSEKERTQQLEKNHNDQMRTWEAKYDRLLKTQRDHDDQKKAWEAEKDSLLKVQKKLETRLQLENFRSTSDPKCVHTIRTKAATKKNLFCDGLTILENELFVVSFCSSVVEVYDSMTFGFRRKFNLADLTLPMDIVACRRNKCLYIIDNIDIKVMLRVDAFGNLIKKWRLSDSWGRLSVTEESNVIYTAFSKNKLIEYAPDGNMIRKIKFSLDTDISHPLHAVKLTNGHFVVSHGYDAGELHRVCIVDADGNLMKSFGGKSGSGIDQLNGPYYLSVDGNGFIMVADFENGRVLLFDSDLNLRGELLSKVKHGLRFPNRILHDEINGRLFVAQNDKNKWRIAIFNLND